jgi:TAG lipase/steryl ester hydrolase/phospholipase A2/LPA acyltransferase
MAKDPLTGDAVPWHDDRRQWIDGSVDGDLPMTRLAEMFNVNHFIVSQVNPHVVPFLAKEDGPGSDSSRRPWISSPWLHTLTSLAREEALHRMSVLSELGIFPNELTKAASILSQKYSGDINIFPEIFHSHFPRMLKNPTAEFMLQACLSGERATWPRIARIRNHVSIELALDSAVQTLRARVALSPAPVTGFGMQNLVHLSWEFLDGIRERSPKLHRRRSSYSHDPDRLRAARATSNRRLSVPLRKARSALSVDCAHCERPPSPVAFSKRMKGPVEKGRSTDLSQSLRNSAFSVVSDSEDETEDFPVTQRLLPMHSATCGPPLIRPTSPRSNRTSPVRSRRSSAAKVVTLPARPHAIDPSPPIPRCETHVLVPRLKDTKGDAHSKT